MNKNNTTSSSNNSNSKRPSATSPSIPHDTPISGHRAGADAGVGRSGDKTTSNKDGSSSSQASTPTATSAVGVSSTSISGQGPGAIVTKTQLDKAKAAMSKAAEVTWAQLMAPPEQTAEDSLSEGSLVEVGSGAPTRALQGR